VGVFQGVPDVSESNPVVCIREADEADFEYVVDLMVEALHPFYGGDHRRHAERIFGTHISGGKDRLGFFSFEQKMFIAEASDQRAGMLHLVGKRQGTYKISPLIVDPAFRHGLHVGVALLDFAENYAWDNAARQIYCTVAESNHEALTFFLTHGYTPAGKSESHYKLGETEIAVYKKLVEDTTDAEFDRPNISVLLMRDRYESQVRDLLLETLPEDFRGVDRAWVDSLFDGFYRRTEQDINSKFKLIYVAVDRDDQVLGVAGATPKKGSPIKVMPLIAPGLPAFNALLTDLPNALKEYGHKLYLHISPTLDQTVALQRRGWKLDSALPGAYHEGRVTQQWSFDMENGAIMRMMRVKQKYLDFIKSGVKDLEVRVAYPQISTITPGEQILFCSRNDKQVVTVTDVRRYPSFKEALSAESGSRIVPGVESEEVLRVLQEIYPADREKLGVVVLQVQPEIHGA